MNVLVNEDMGVLSRCTHISHQHDKHFNYLTILLVNYTSVKAKT